MESLTCNGGNHLWKENFTEQSLSILFGDGAWDWGLQGPQILSKSLRDQGEELGVGTLETNLLLCNHFAKNVNLTPFSFI